MRFNFLFRAGFAILLVTLAFNVTAQAQKPLRNKTASQNKLTAEGIDLFERGDKASARLSLEKALKINPQDVEAHTYLGILDDESGNSESAALHFSKSVSLTPRSPAARNNYGAILLRLNRKREAIKEFEASLKLDPNQANALINLAQIRFEEATPESLKTSLTLFGRADALVADAAIKRSLVIISLQLNNPSQSEEYYRAYQDFLVKTSAKEPTSAERIQLGGALFEVGLLNQAETELKAALAQDAANTEAIERLARVYIARNEISAAGKLLETAAAKNQATAAIYSLLAVVYEKSNHYENAIPAMRLAINLDPQSEKYRFQYGILLTNADAPAAAVIRLNEALKTFPKSPRLWLARGIAELKDNKNVEAAQSISKAIELDQSFAQAYAYLGLAQFQIGQYDTAVQQYEKALVYNGKLAVVHQMIADALLQKTSSDQPRIEAELKKSIALDPKLYLSYLTLGKLYVRMQRWADSATAFEEAIKLQPNSAEAYYQLGRVYIRLKRKSDSDIALAKFKELNDSEKLKSESELRETVRRLADVRF